MPGFLICLITIVIICLFYPVYCGALLTTYLKDHYTIVDLETNSDLCEGRLVSVTADGPAIIRLGYTGVFNSSIVRECELRVKSPPGYGLSMTINSMNLNFRQNQFTGRVTCLDYVRFTRQRDTILARLLGNLLSAFEDRSAKICRGKYEMDNRRPELYYVGQRANIFYALKNRIKFKYKRGKQRDAGKKFSIIATAFKTTEGTCPSQYIRCGIESLSFCISERLRCDSFINCGFPGSGVDEQGCNDDGWSLDGSLSTPTFIWVTLVLTLAVFICCLISCALRCWGGPSPGPANGRLRMWFVNTRPLPASAPTSSSGAAAERQHLSPLPSYESVVRELGSQDTDLQAPPAYKDLFPEPPPTPPGAERVLLTVPSVLRPEPPAPAAVVPAEPPDRPSDAADHPL